MESENVSRACSLFESLKHTPESFTAGNIKHFWEKWTEVTSDKNLLAIIANGYKLEFETEPCVLCSRGEIAFNKQEELIVDDLLKTFLKKKVIEVATPEIGQVLSHIFIRPKSDGSFRLILNLSNLNEHIGYVHFKMETLKTVLGLVRRNCYFAKVDLKDAYYSIPIAHESRKYLRFTWRGQLYQFTSLANGLGCAPRIYTKLMKPVFATLRKQGHINSTYIDDSLLQSDTFQECSENVSDTLSLLDSLGLTVHPDKSVIIPAQSMEFIGFLINSVDMTVRLTARKSKEIVELCQSLLCRDIVTIREFSQLIGKLVAAEPGVMYAPIYYKTLEIQKDEALKYSKGDFDVYMALSNQSKQCLQWWVKNVESSFKPISVPKPDRKIESDSSGFAYGARDVTNGQDISGAWTEEEKEHHINYLELKAAFLALKGLCAHVRNEHIHLYLDNTTAIKYLSKMGGRKPVLNDLTREVWIWCAERNIMLTVFHIAGERNVHADRLSRQKVNKDMEWMLDRQIFGKIMSLFGRCEIDLFASCHNYQICPYVSYLPDPKAYAINAFSLNWGDFYSFLFPPFSVISAAIQKVEEDLAEAVLVAPMFTTQAWFPRLLRMVTDYPRILPKSENLLVQPNTQELHPLKKMVLCVFRISGKSWKTEAFRQKLPVSLSHHGDPVRGNSMGRICQNGCYFVVKQKYLHFNHL